MPDVVGAVPRVPGAAVRVVGREMCVKPTFMRLVVK